MKILYEHIIVKVPSVFHEETEHIGYDGKQIILDVLYNPERHVRCYGIVVSTPDDLFKIPIASNEIGGPDYHDNEYKPTTWKYAEDIELEVQVGDKVYFHYNCLLPDRNDQKWNKLYLYSRVEDGRPWHYFRVKYDLVYASVRYIPINNQTVPFSWSFEKELKPHIGKDKFYFTDKSGTDQVYNKQVVMIGSYVFIEPDMETWEDISIPIHEVVNGKKMVNPDGSYIFKPKDQWLVCKKEPGEKYLRGWVRFTGSPLKGDKEFLRPGMYVYFQRFANTKINFEGKNYFRMRQRHIIGIASF